ncbi:TniB family NTP-binding protein [Rhizobium leguminosarum]|uniref:TniB family NTP-binding protein n=1 Tax=Rhizobium leguminosarum TaxID=384 RepID=UPI001C9544D0|nr:TniB family NTP-binding protein [Rhizobium leguminosarum]MBY5660459.1 AAA family ATPase [Rhizobium leguminosarum]MBY5674082.1 AAA family ATPase [Rhizobium leguminosarum]
MSDDVGALVAAAMMARMDDVELRKVEIMKRVESMITDTNNDEDVIREIKAVVRGAVRSTKVGHALIIVGESHIGKSTLINSVLDAQKPLAKIPDGFGDFYYPLLRVKAPPDCTMKALGEDMLGKLGYDPDRKMDEPTIFRMLRSRLRQNGVKVVFIDEFQHVLDAPKVKGVRHLTDTLKNMLQEDGWPIHLILCGLPEIVQIVDRDPKEQMEGRTIVLRLDELNCQEHSDLVALQFQAVLEEAGLGSTIDFGVDDPLTTDFLERLFHGARNRLGLMFRMLHFTIEDAIDHEEDTVTLEHWVRAYAKLAKRGRNVFTEKEFWTIKRGIMRDGTLTLEEHRGRLIEGRAAPEHAGSDAI